MDRKKCSVVLVNDVFEELNEENKRLLNELLFSNKCFKILLELKFFVESVFDKNEYNFNSNDRQRYEELRYEIQQILKGNNITIKSEPIEENNELNDNCDNDSDFDYKSESNSESSSDSFDKTAIKKKNKRIDETDRQKSSPFECNDKLVHESPDQPIVCPIEGCGKQFKSELLYEKHRDRTHQPKTFNCNHPGCKFYGSDLRNLNIHKRTHTELTEPYVCFTDGCGKAFKTSSELELHTKSHSLPRFECTHEGCELKFITEQYLNEHINKCHLKKVKRKYERKACNSQPYSCDWPGCHFTTFNYWTCRYHKLDFHSDFTFKCLHDNCGKLFKGQRHLKQHMKSHSGVKHIEKWFKCDHPDCTFGTYRASNLKSHQKIHSGEKPFACHWPGCEYKNSRKSEVDRHMKSHTNAVDQFKCTFEGCDKAFKGLTGLRSHRATYHIKSEEYRCEWPGCDFKTYYNTRITKHKAIHIDDKPHACSYPGCQFRTKHKQNLYPHMKLHK